jgi:hypothetical protein
LRIFLHDAAEQIKPMRIRAAQVALAQRDAVPVEEFQYLDGNLAPVVEAVPELRGRECGPRRSGRYVDAYVDHLGHRFAREEMVVRHLVDPPQPTEQFQQPTDIGFGHNENARDIANTRRTKSLGTGQKRLDARPQRFVLGC